MVSAIESLENLLIEARDGESAFVKVTSLREMFAEASAMRKRAEVAERERDAALSRATEVEEELCEIRLEVSLYEKRLGRDSATPQRLHVRVDRLIDWLLSQRDELVKATFLPETAWLLEQYRQASKRERDATNARREAIRLYHAGRPARLEATAEELMSARSAKEIAGRELLDALVEEGQ